MSIVLEFDNGVKWYHNYTASAKDTVIRMNAMGFKLIAWYTVELQPNTY